METETDKKILEHKKDVLLSLLKHQASELNSMIYDVESDDVLCRESIQGFFRKRKKTETRLLKEIFRN